MTSVEMWSVVDVFSMPERKRSGKELHSFSKTWYWHCDKPAFMIKYWRQSLKMDLLLDRVFIQKRAQLVHLFLWWIFRCMLTTSLTELLSCFQHVYCRLLFFCDSGVQSALALFLIWPRGVLKLEIEVHSHTRFTVLFSANRVSKAGGF